MDANEQSILIATSQGLFRAAQEEPVAFEGRHVRSLVSDQKELFAVVGRREIWRAPREKAPNGGGAWTLLTRLERQGACLFPGKERLWIGTTEAHLLTVSRRGDSSGVVEAELVTGFEAAEGRDSWFTPWGGPPAVRSICQDTEGNLFVNVHVGGVLRSRDAGVSWHQTVDIGIDVHQVIPGPEASMLLAATGKGFAESRDRGDSWSLTGEGLDFSYMRAVAIAGEQIFASAATGPHGDTGAVYRRSIDEKAFRKCGKGLPEWFAGNVDTFCIGSDGVSLLALGVPGGVLYVSEDSGESWVRAEHQLPQINGVLIP